MQKVNQGHQLKSIWEVEDAVNTANQSAATANQSAAIAQQYHQLTAQNVSAVSLEIDRVNQKLSFALSELSRLDSLLTDSRTHCVVWGIGSAIVTSLVMSLITASFNPPQKPVIQQSVEPMQSTIVESAPQIQKPRFIQPKAIKRVKSTQKRG